MLVAHTVISEIRLYELLKTRIGEKEAEAFIQIIEEKMEKKFDQKKSELATKEDVSSLRAELLRTIYLTSLGQLIAIIASVVSLMLVLKK
jgi:hypothetical protein